MQELENNLTAEIEFWRELIDNRSLDAPPESLERMRQALALAEHKLLLMEHATGSTLIPGSNLATPGSIQEH